MKKYKHLEKEILSLHNKGVRPTQIYRELGIPKSSYLHIRRELNLESRAITSKDISIETLMEHLVGMVLGDGNLRKSTKFSSVISFAHAERYKDYFDYKVKILSSLGGYIERQNYFDKRTSKYYPRYCYTSYSIKDLKYLRDNFYPEGKKIIPMDIVRKHFSSISLAILFMDDGYSQLYTTGCATQCFEKDNLLEFVEFLKEKFCLEFTIQKNGYIRLKQKDRKKFFSLIGEEVDKINSMQYKLKFMSS